MISIFVTCISLLLIQSHLNKRPAATKNFSDLHQNRANGRHRLNHPNRLAGGPPKTGGCGGVNAKRFTDTCKSACVSASNRQVGYAGKGLNATLLP